MWYKNVASRFFELVTKHACDRQTDGQTELRLPVFEHINELTLFSHWIIVNTYAHSTCVDTRLVYLMFVFWA